MAKVVEFYVPKNFRNQSKWVPPSARWKGHRVLPTDEEISLAQPVRYLEVCWSREGDQSGICHTQ